MGTTHYWQHPIELPRGAFVAAIDDCRKILPRTGVPLAGFRGVGEAVFNDDVIQFNGPRGAGCESFEIRRNDFDRSAQNIVRSFCKTRQLPYDLCVKVALIVFKHHLGGLITVTSDENDFEWAEARRVCQETLGYGEGFQTGGTNFLNNK